MISSVIVAKQGRGGMALSNAVGSNIFDILIGLGLPWAVIIMVRNTTVPVVTDDLFVSVILLFASVLVILAILVINNWTIGKKAGIFLVSLYLVFLMYVILESLLFPS
jgi:Ca2+/Na+ antiporter